MKGAIFAYSRQGCQTARRIRSQLTGEVLCYTMERFQEPGFSPIDKKRYGELFAWADTMIFVGACGIAVREIAPFVRDKRTDPAVICIDELGRFVIPLLSGHIGGANALAQALAQALGAVPVITTATDIHGRFSVDSWAVNHGCAIGSMPLAKAVSAAVLEGEVPFYSQFPISGQLPRGLTLGQEGPLGIAVTLGSHQPFERTLQLIPRIVHLGIGCRKGTSAKTIENVVAETMASHGLDIRCVKSVASIDLKAQEPGLLEVCRNHGWPVEFYTPEELKALSGPFTPSDFVSQVTGVDNVCERAACMKGQQLIVKKTARCGVTVGAAAEHWEVSFWEK